MSATISQPWVVGSEPGGLRRPAGARRGISAVEMAVVGPVVLLFAIAASDFGRIIPAYVAVANAARTGAEYGSMHHTTNYTLANWSTRVAQAVTSDLQGHTGFNVQKMTVTTNVSTDSDSIVQVTVAVKYGFDTMVNWPVGPTHVDLFHQVSMRQIR